MKAVDRRVDAAGSDGGAVVGWPMVGAGTALIGTCYGLARFAYGLFAPEFAREFTINSTLSGMIGAGSYLGYCVAIVASLLLTPRWGPRSVATIAGVVATVGMSVVAFAPTAPVLAVGILIAGASTGIASPPLAMAVSSWIRQDLRDRAQTVINAGTGLGVLISGPVALLLLDQWRVAWAAFALIAAAVTCWAHATVPSETDRPSERTDESLVGEGVEIPGGNMPPDPQRLMPGTARLLAASFLMGLASIAVWTFGRDLIENHGGASTLVSVTTWSVLGACGILGALGGDLAARAGLPVSWTALMIIMGAATALFALDPSSTVVVLTAAASFGASYIALTGLVLIWSTRLYPERSSFGVGIAFLTIAAGQAVGAPLVGRLTTAIDPTTVFQAWALLALLGATLRPPRQSANHT